MIIASDKDGKTKGKHIKQYIMRTEYICNTNSEQPSDYLAHG